MRLALLTALTMVAFAANSILNRLAVDSGAISPEAFASIRVAAGAGILTLLVLGQGGKMQFRTARRALGVVALSVYMIGFSLAYRSLDAGLGALVLFGVVQMTMFSWSAIQGQLPSGRKLAGAGIAFLGLVWVLWPGTGAAADPVGAALMGAAGVGWAAYTLVGRTEPDALAGTAANFVAALPLVALLPIAAGIGSPTAVGVALAVLSGAVTSGLGYAMWYRVLPFLDTGLAAIVQLSVPVLALLGGVVLLGEGATWSLLVGAICVVGGIALAVRGS